jgi:hypothetical protein
MSSAAACIRAALSPAQNCATQKSANEAGDRCTRSAWIALVPKPEISAFDAEFAFFENHN